MSSRVCIGCGEPLPENVSVHSRHEHLCPSCSSLVDGTNDLPQATPPKPPSESPPTAASDNDDSLRRAA